MLDDYRQVVEDNEVFVAVEAATVTGVLVMQPEDSDMLLVNIAVLPACKGKGLGKVLMQFCEAYSRQAGCQGIRLYTHERMTENIEIYQKLGYVQTHRAQAHGFARVFMRKPL
ncbi:GNAT family N-acetyltransferase [Pseudomonas sp. KU43P]|uniref:GNAT family N-acetyltransferase n=1 Tax=Pseudomonas sp. KU43P TaxID=2487887 RepID=UPI0012A9CED8|nr:GNAT family N-acetyltransferase [Pseudomonas sp. KU43P]BBH45817.1 hypothetical protein KU43P_22940 [Pseudomonas sp. KU43P]